MIGDERHGASTGPERFVQGGGEALLAARGVAVTVKRIERGEPFRDSASASLAINRELQPVVRQAIAAGELPVVLAGSCDVSIGIVAAFEHGRCGVVWIDAHGDFNTPESTVSGFFAGMSLAVITGHCYRNYWAQLGHSAPISEAATVLLGVRDLTPAEERQRLERSSIEVVSWRAGRPRGDVSAALDALTKRVQEVYLHVDLDALDPAFAPGIVDTPVAGGLSLHDLEEAVRAVAGRFRVIAVALTTYNPELDEDEKTLRAGLHVLDVLADSVGDGAQ